MSATSPAVPSFPQVPSTPCFSREARRSLGFTSLRPGRSHSGHNLQMIHHGARPGFALVSALIILSNRGMSYWTSVILGVIEGITEFLPISSTGHLLLAEQWLPRQSDLFNVVIQCGAVLAVLPLFPERLRQFVGGWREPAVRDYLLKILLAFAVTGAGGLVLEKNHFKLPEALLPVAIALAVGGVLFLGMERWLKGRTASAEVTWAIALAVGAGQLVAAIFPGSSRSGTTILVALLLGLNRPLAIEFSFLVGIPTMLAAGGLKIFKAVHHAPPGGVQEDWGMLLLATVIAALVSFAAVKWMLNYVRSHTFALFGWYRIALGGLLVAFLFFNR